MGTEKFKEKILYLKLKQKDKDAFAKAYDMYIDDIYRFIYFKVGSKEDAEDLTSFVFLKTWDYIQNNSLTDFKTLKSLFYKVARNIVIDHYRKKSGEKTVSIESDESDERKIDLPDEKQNVDRVVSSIIDFEIIEEKLCELKDEYREVIIMRYINELSISEIATVMDKTNGNIRVLVYRAIKALKKIADK